MILELDVDGVVASIHSDLNKLVSDKFSIDFDAERDIKSWGMKELDSDIRTYILSLFSNPDYIGNLNVIDGTLEALTLIDAKLRELGWFLLFNTNVCKGCKDARALWLDNLIKETGIRAVKVVGDKSEKYMAKSTIVVDDHAVNLCNSKSPVKVLMRRGSGP